MPSATMVQAAPGDGSDRLGLNAVADLMRHISTSSMYFGALEAAHGMQFSVQRKMTVPKHAARFARQTVVARKKIASTRAVWLVRQINKSQSQVRLLQHVMQQLMERRIDDVLARQAVAALVPVTTAPEVLRKLLVTDFASALRFATLEMHVVELRLARAAESYGEHPEVLGDIGAGVTDLPATLQVEPGFEAVRDSLLAQAGGGLSLTEAAQRLGISRQALHKRINADTALGMMRDEQIVLPKAQFIEQNGRTEILAGLREVLAVFREAQAPGWPALDFLLTKDPNLGGALPLEALRAGHGADVVAAARAHLGLDSG